MEIVRLTRPDSLTYPWEKFLEEPTFTLASETDETDETTRFSNVAHAQMSNLTPYGVREDKVANL